MLEISNSVAPEGPSEPEMRVEPAGLGSRLIQAFTTQLGGSLTQERQADVYRVHVAFALKDFEADETVPTKVPNVPDF